MSIESQTEQKQGRPGQVRLGDIIPFPFGWRSVADATTETANFSGKMPKKAIVALALADLLAYLIAFSLVMVITKRDLLSRFTDLILLAGLLLIWGTSSLLTRKLSRLVFRTFLDNVRAFSLSFFIMLGGFSLLLTVYPPALTSRLVLVSSLLLGFTLEVVMLRSVTPGFNRNAKSIRLIESTRFLIIDLSIIISALAVYVLLVVGFRGHSETLPLFAFSVLFVWFASSVFTHQFKLIFKQSYWNYASELVKVYFVFGCLVSFLALIFRVHGTPKDLLLATMGAYVSISFIVFSRMFFRKIPGRTDETRLAFLKATPVGDDLVDADKISTVDLCEPELVEDNHASFRDKLRDIHLKNFPELFAFIDHRVDLSKLSFKYSIVIRTDDAYNVEVLPDNCLQLFVNLYQLNGMREVNRYLSMVNRKLSSNGLFIGCFEPNKSRYNRFLRKYPFYFAQFFYMLDFVWHRVFPKLPLLQGFYLAVSKGRKRAFSIAEALGRLYYNGFHLASAVEIDGFVYFLVLKKSLPCLEKAPLYGPLFKMKRVGENGKSIYVYKMRTMHPYSEYLQEFVYDAYNLEVGGKLKNDFRITAWGRIFRKLWIDELPMFINFFKGDLKLVGVRPLSSHYLSLYDEDLRLRRMKHKPGLVPPFYVDMPKTLKEIMESERKYLDAYEKSPRLTDFRYLVKAIRNIVLKGARSA